MNIFFGLFWLAVALGLFLWPWLVPNSPLPTIRGTEIPLAWLAVLFALYSLARWWAARSGREERRREAAQQDERRRRLEKAPERLPKIPDPSFDFTEGPPRRKPGDRPQTPS